MSWLIWRLYRAQAATAASLLAALAALLLVTGVQMAAQWHSALVTCAQSHTCGTLPDTLFLGSHAVGFLVIMTLGVPAVLGMLCGAPLVAHEFETGTSQFAWTQSITQRRWLAVKAGWLLLAAAAVGGVISGLVTWWSGPDNALQANGFNPGRFDIMGVVPVGYAVFAMALGITAGALVRRTLPAVGITLAGFIAVRFVIFSWVRPHFISAVTTYFPLNRAAPATGSFWQLAAGFVGADGRPISIPQSTTGQVLGTAGGGIPVSSLPAPCQALAGGGNAPLSPAVHDAVLSCAQAHHIRGYLTYQPAGRYWTFQAVETGIFVLLAAALLAVTFTVLSRRDA
jgi:hypothetical protein